MEKIKAGQVIELEITRYAFGGKGISLQQTAQGEKIIFVQNALPGQKVVARVVKSKSRFAECKLLKVIRRAPDEIEVPFQEISGAPYSRLPLSRQKELKEQSAIELYRRIGKIENIEALFEGWIDAPDAWHYRNKMEYSFSAINHNPETNIERDAFSLGFKKRGSWWAVENLNADSGLFDKEVEDKLHLLREYFENTGLAAWNPRSKSGYFKNLVVRKSFAQNKLMINLITGEDERGQFNDADFVSQCLELWGERVSGIFHAVNDSTGDRSAIEDRYINLLYGIPVLTEQISGLEFELGIKSFFQPNPACAEKLYSRALEYVSAHPLEEGVLLDLFCGTGTIAQLLAKTFPGREVIGVDITPSSIRDASANADRNGLQGLRFIAGDAGKFLYEHPELKGNISTVVLDPPRAGIAPKTLNKIINLGMNHLVYISCNPATQARDCEILGQAGYRMKKISLADQFPHTAHVEAVALFSKN